MILLLRMIAPYLSFLFSNIAEYKLSTNCLVSKCAVSQEYSGSSWGN